MKKTMLLNAQLSRCIASVGHTESLTICDAGLPIPLSVERIDLALTAGVPSFLQTLNVVTNEMYVERVVIAEEITEDDLIEMMVGRRLDEQYPHLSQEKGECVLDVKHVSGSSIDDVSFKLHAGEIVGVSGLMGAGRTELGKLLYGALPKTAGKVRLKNQEIENLSPQDGLDNGIVYISEDRKGDGLVLGMSVKENMSLTSLDHFSNRGSIRHQAEKMAVDDFILMFNIKTPNRDQQVGLLSGGNQQKVAIARGLMTRPNVLILDEPTRGVDVGAKKEIYQLINEFKKEGLSILMISSDMPEVLGMSDRVLVMREGKISAEFSREEATQEKLLAAAIGK